MVAAAVKDDANPGRKKIENKNIDRILKKVTNFDWSKVPDINNWSLGVNKHELKKLCDYWVTNYNWKKTENKINEFVQKRAVDAEEISVVICIRNRTHILKPSGALEEF